MIAFDSYRPGTGGSRDVYVYDRDVAAVIGLQGCNTADYEGHPSIGGLVPRVFLTCDSAGSSGGSDVYTYNIGSKLRTRPSGLNGSGSESDPQVTWPRTYVAFASDEMGTRDIYLYDIYGMARVNLPGLNTSLDDEEMPGISDDGNLIVFQSNRIPADAGGVDVYLWDRDAIALVNTPGLNSSADDRNPAISADGKYIAFDSDRSGGAGNRDVYVYSLITMSLVTPSPWNSSADDYWPHLNQTGDLMTFASDRPGGMGAADIYLYRFSTSGFVDLPGLNSPQTDENASIY